MAEPANILYLDPDRKPGRKKSGGGGSRTGISYKGSKAPEPEDVRELLHTLQADHSERGQRDFAILLVLIRTGMRASELVRLKRTDLISTRKRCYIEFDRPKSKDRHIVLLSREAFEQLAGAVDAYMKTARLPRTGFIFHRLPHLSTGERSPLTTRGLQMICNGWPITDTAKRPTTPHSYRHFTGLQISEHRDFIQASKVLGHRNPRVTAQYYTSPHVEGLMDF